MKQKFTLTVLSFQREKKVGKEKAGNGGDVAAATRGGGAPLWTPRAAFTLIELLVSVTCQIGVLPLYCLKKIHKNCTSLRPSGRTSRLPQANSSHLHIFTRSAFTLIELLVSKTCQICVYILRKIASCLDICRCNSAKCGIVGFANAKTAIHQKFLARMDGARGRKGEPFFKKGSLPSPAPFTLIELLVTTAQQNCFSKNKNDTSSGFFK